LVAAHNGTRNVAFSDYSKLDFTTAHDAQHVVGLGES